MSDVFQPPTCQWLHSDAQLWDASQEAVVRAENHALFSERGAYRVRLLRAFAARSVLAAADLSDAAPTPQGTTALLPDLSAVGWPTPQHQELAAGLLHTFAALTAHGRPSHAVIVTELGVPATFSVPEAAAPWAWAAVAVVGIAAYTFTLAYFAEETSYVADRAGKRRDIGDKLAEVHAQLLKLAEQHTEAERVAQKTLPINAVELEVLAALRKEQDALLGIYQSEKPAKKPPGFFGGFLGGALPFVVLGGLGLYALSTGARNG